MKGGERVKHPGQFIGVRDSRNRRVRGIYTRNGRFYGLLWTDGADTSKKTARRFPLVDEFGTPCTTLAQAKEAYERLRGDRRAKTLPTAGRKPSFASWVDEYLSRCSTLEKRPGTIENETQALSRWKSHLGSVTVDRITTPMISAFIEKRLRGGVFGERSLKAAAPRTARLDCIALRNVLKAAMDAGHLRDLPRFPAVKVPPPPRRSLVTPSQFNDLLAACTAQDADGLPITKNGEQLRDFLKLLAFTGCREQEGLRIKWAHVDMEGQRLFVGAGEDFVASKVTVGHGGESKNRGCRIVDFNPQLEELLLDMQNRKAPDCSWLFPSPQRGSKDAPAKTLRESLEKARTHANLPKVGFHDLRHLFCSFCVMAGIDFMTIAAWLGHKDGGILVGKVYGHLLDAHRKNAAARLTIGLAPLARAIG